MNTHQTQPIFIIFPDDTFRFINTCNTQQFEIIQNLYSRCKWDIEIEEIATTSELTPEIIHELSITPLGSIVDSHVTIPYLPLSQKENYTTYLTAKLNALKVNRKVSECITNIINTNTNTQQPISKKPEIKSVPLLCPRFEVEHKKEPLLFPSFHFGDTQTTQQPTPCNTLPDKMTQLIAQFDRFHNQLDFNQYFFFPTSSFFKPKKYKKLVYSKIAAYDDDNNSGSIRYVYMQGCENNGQNIYVIKSEKCAKTFVFVNPSSEVLSIIRQPEFDFVIVFNLMAYHPAVSSIIQTLFNDIDLTVVDLQQQIEACACQIDHFINNELVDKNEQYLITQYIETNYTITDNSEDRIKATELLSIIQNEVFSNIKNRSGFLIRLSSYLTLLGIHKKRYGDGYYFCGLVNKITAAPHYALENKVYYDGGSVIPKIKQFNKDDISYEHILKSFSSTMPKTSNDGINCENEEKKTDNTDNTDNMVNADTPSEIKNIYTNIKNIYENIYDILGEDREDEDGKKMIDDMTQFLTKFRN